MKQWNLSKFNKHRHKIYQGLNPASILLVVGLTILIMSIAFGLLSYSTYTSGRPALLYNGKFGTRYVEEISSGNLHHKELAFMCFKIAGAGLIISTGGLAIKYLKKEKTISP
jgi:hypothetical protein